jgi:ectoine hydroxylase-related dioxygenase (phytanoyl-CoA dioxygenase family)
MPKTLTAQQAGDFERNGFTSPITVLSAPEVEFYAAQCAELERRIGTGGIIWRRMLHVHFEWAYRLAVHPAVLDAVEDLLGPDIMVLSTILFAKPPDRTQYVSWHQDGRPMIRTGAALRALTAWIAMSDSHEENGCLRIIPGTHRDGYRPHASRADSANMLRGGEHLALDVDESQAVPVVLRPGQMSLHHVDAVHGSRPNRGGAPRLGFTIRFAAAEVELSREQFPRVAARGTPRSDLYSVFTGTPPADMRSGMESLTAAIEGMLAREASTGLRF